MAYSNKKPISAKMLRWRQDRAKLTLLDELEIQQSSEPPRVICERYGVHYKTIYWVRFRDQWREQKKKRLAEKPDLD